MKRRRHVEFENFVLSFDNDGNISNVPIKYSRDKYTQLRTRMLIPRGESWGSDSAERPRLLAKLRMKLRRLREARKSDRSRYDQKMSALWHHAMEARSLLYRHALLEALDSTADDPMVEVPAEWAEAVIHDAQQSAKEVFHDVYR